MGFPTYAVALLVIMAGLSEISGTVQVCEDGWSYYEGKCYQYVDEEIYLEDAFSKCNEIGAYLVKIDNQGENDFIGSLAQSGYFAIGLRRDSQNVFRWTDGTTPSYTNWNKGEPNNAGGNEGCGMMYIEEGQRKYKWNDTICSGRLKMQYVCEKEANVPSECYDCLQKLMC